MCTELIFLVFYYAQLSKSLGFTDLADSYKLRNARNLLTTVNHRKGDRQIVTIIIYRYESEIKTITKVLSFSTKCTGKS